MRYVFLFLFILFIVGCSDKGQTTESLSVFESAPPTEVPELIAAYGVAPSKSAAGVVAFYTGNRYFSGVVREISTRHFQIMATIGFYEQPSLEVRTTARRTTCRAAYEKYKTQGRKILGKVGGGTLTVVTEKAAAYLTRFATFSPATISSGFIVEFGCFDEATGIFTPEAWTNL